MNRKQHFFSPNESRQVQSGKEVEESGEMQTARLQKKKKIFYFEEQNACSVTSLTLEILQCGLLGFQLNVLNLHMSI